VKAATSERGRGGAIVTRTVREIAEEAAKGERATARCDEEGEVK
jgi:hypothetical protein